MERIKLEDLQTSISKLRYNIEKKRKNIREITTMRRKKQVDLSLTNESKYTAAQIKLAQAKIRDREMREEINQLREERMSKIVLLHELAEKKEELKDRIVKTQCDIKGVKEEEGKYREITAKLQEEVGKRIAELKKQYLELGKGADVFVHENAEDALTHFLRRQVCRGTHREGARTSLEGERRCRGGETEAGEYCKSAHKQHSGQDGPSNCKQR